MSVAVPATLTELLQPAQSQGTEVAWQRFVEQYSRLMLSVARKVSNDYDVAMDNYTFILEQLRRNNFHKLRSYTADPRCKFTTWLVVVCRRVCIDAERHRSGRVRPGSDVIALKERRSLAQKLASEPTLDTLIASGVAPDDYTEQREQQTRLDQCLARLEPRDRLLLELRFEHELSAAQIMTLLALPTPFHVYRRVNRLLADLRAALHLGAAAPQSNRDRPFNVR